VGGVEGTALGEETVVEGFEGGSSL
jgi:hypothetical protein